MLNFWICRSFLALGAVFLLWAGALWAGDNSLKVPAGPAPALRPLKASAEEALGSWDDAYAPKDSDYVIARRGKDLFKLPFEGQAQPELLASASDLEDTKIITGTRHNDKSWIFFHSKKTNPFAFEIFGKQMVKFDIPGVKVPGEQTADIQSWVFVPRESAALLMIAGGDQASWPRDGNRPIYYWLDLSSGRSLQLPVGYDLDYFSADQKTAVFIEPRGKSGNRSLKAFYLSLGKYLEKIPDRQTEKFISFDWTNTDEAKPVLHARNPETGDQDRLVGISTNGAISLFEAFFKNPDVPEIKTRNGWGAFQFRDYEAPSNAGRHSLWGFPLIADAKPRLLSESVSEFELLDEGRCLFVVSGYGSHQDSQEAFFYDDTKSAGWNVLEGVERLPELDADLRKKDFISDRMTVRLVPGFGQSRQRSAVLALFSHERGDNRAFVVLPNAPTPELKRQSWHRAFLLTHDGERYEVPDFKNWAGRDHVWFHPSGSIISDKTVWDEKGRQQIELFRTALEIRK